MTGRGGGRRIGLRDRGLVCFLSSRGQSFRVSDGTALVVLGDIGKKRVWFFGGSSIRITNAPNVESSALGLAGVIPFISSRLTTGGHLEREEACAVAREGLIRESKGLSGFGFSPLGCDGWME